MRLEEKFVEKESLKKNGDYIFYVIRLNFHVFRYEFFEQFKAINFLVALTSC